MSHPPHRPPLRVGMVQLKPRKAAVEQNLARIREHVVAGAPEHDLLVFPEASTSGYFLEGGVAEAALSVEALAEGLGAPPADAPDVVVGFYERWRRRLYNAAAWLTPEDGAWKPVHVHRKMFLPTYGVFDEARFVETGTELSAFDTRWGRMGLLVCEEMWHSLPPTVLALAGAELLVVVSASPARDFSPGSGGRPGNLERWDRLAQATAQEHGVFVLVAQLVGSEGGKLFPGGSIVVGPDGAQLVRGPLYGEAVVTAVLRGTDIDRARFGTPLLAGLEQMLPHLQRALARARRSGLALDDGIESGENGSAPAAPPAPAPERALLPSPALGGRAREAEGAEGAAAAPAFHDPGLLDLDLALVERTLVEFIREEVIRRRGFRRVVLGVSGGVDSAVSLYLAARALGPENVHGFRLPYATSSVESREHAGLVLAATGAVDRTLDITGPIDRYVDAFEPDISPLRKGNLMARLRAVILFDQSARLEALPLGTGNKSERLLGYFTWHADDSPPINPLGDLFKTQVWALARHLGVPEAIVEKPATADLVKGVTDEDEIGIGYHRADPILYWLLRGYAPAELVREGFDEAEVALVWRRLNATHWKRELPTVAILSSSAIGEFYLRPVDY